MSIILYPEERVIIFDLSEPIVVSRRYGRRKKVEEEAEEVEQVEREEVVEEPALEVPAKRGRGRPRKNA